MTIGPVRRLRGEGLSPASRVIDLRGADQRAAVSAVKIAAPPRTALAPSWVALVFADAVGLTLPGWFATHGRFELLAMAMLAVLLFQSAGLYKPKLRLSLLDDAPALLLRVVLASVVVGVITGVIGYGPVVSTYVTLAVLATAATLIMRLAAIAIIRRARALGRVSHRTLLIGGGDISARIANQLLNEPSYGLKPIGFLDGNPRRPRLRVPYLGTPTDLARTLSDSDVAVVIVAFGSLREAELVDVLRETERRGCDVFVVPRLFEIHSYGQTDHVGAVPVVRLHRPRLNRLSWWAKRLFDIVVSVVALLLLSPVLAVIAVAVRFEGGPGVIFRQQRVGLDGRRFDLLKFRSLRPVDDNESATLWSVAHDDRLGSVGRILRRTSVDEIPQLWNVVRGEMTLVGPRPERPHFVDGFTEEIPGYRHRHRVAAGLTGLAQVNGLRGDTSIHDRSRYDNFYIENWSLWLDMKIICTTVKEVVGARGR